MFVSIGDTYDYKQLNIQISDREVFAYKFIHANNITRTAIDPYEKASTNRFNVLEILS